MSRRKGITWQRRKQLCKGKGCHNVPPNGKELCGECWRTNKQIIADGALKP